MHSLGTQGRPSTDVERAAVIEEFWASRNAWADFINAERRAAWERKRAGILERDLPPGHTYRVETGADSRVLPLRRKRDQSEDLESKVQGYRFYSQPRSLQIPLP